MEYIKTSYSEKITLKDIATLYFYNEKHLGRAFKKHVGISFNDYLNNFRLKKATEKLCLSDKSITESALECGFSNSAYFD